MQAAIAAGEAAVAAATEVRRERRPRIRRRSNAPAVELLAPGNRLNWFPPAAPAWSQHARMHTRTYARMLGRPASQLTTKDGGIFLTLRSLHQVCEPPSPLWEPLFSSSAIL